MRYAMLASIFIVEEQPSVENRIERGPAVSILCYDLRLTPHTWGTSAPQTKMNAGVTTATTASAPPQQTSGVGRKKDHEAGSGCAKISYYVARLRWGPLGSGPASTTPTSRLAQIVKIFLLLRMCESGEAPLGSAPASTTPTCRLGQTVEFFL